MSKAQHTPGPWEIGGRTDADTGGFHICQSETGNGICGLWSGYSIPDDVQNANARLIAAAPELLEALEVVIRGVPDTWGGVKNARAAIAKAKGE